MDTTNSIFIGIDNQRIELLGSDKEAFLADFNLRKQEAEAEAEEKIIRESVRQSALAKLAALGLTEAEIAALYNG
jgi:DNA-binding NarL/FixJ family response regulator